MEFDREHVLRRHRVALDGPGATVPRESHRCLCQGVADPAPAEPGASDEARHRPHALVGLVLSAALPGDANVAEQARMVGARCDRAPAHGLVPEVGDQATRGSRSRMITFGLLAQAGGELLAADGRPRLPRHHTVPLAPASRRVGAGAEDRLEVLPRRPVGRHDPQVRRFQRLGHAATVHSAEAMGQPRSIGSPRPRDRAGWTGADEEGSPWDASSSRPACRSTGS